MEPLRFIVSVDDAGLGQPEEVEARSMRFFADQRVPASFFVIPDHGRSGTIASDAAWLRRARRWEADGFDYQLHGCTHDGFEFGPPEPWMVRICGPGMVAEEARGFAGMRHLWTDDELRRKLQRGISLFGDAFGRRPEVFRAGCLAASHDAFRVMGEVGLRYDSNKIVNPALWDMIAGDLATPRPWDPAVPPVPYRLTDAVTELPCMGEYAWELRPETLDAFTGAAERDMAAVHERGGIFILMCHQQEVGKDDDLSRRSLAHIFDHARRVHDARFMTLRELAALIDRGGVAA